MRMIMVRHTHHVKHASHVPTLKAKTRLSHNLTKLSENLPETTLPGPSCIHSHTPYGLTMLETGCCQACLPCALHSLRGVARYDHHSPRPRQ